MASCIIRSPPRCRSRRPPSAVLFTDRGVPKTPDVDRRTAVSSSHLTPRWSKPDSNLGPTLSLGAATWVELGASGSARQSDRCWDGANPWVSLPSMCRFVSNSPRLSTLLTTRHRTAAIRRSSIAAALKKPVVIAYYCFGNVNHFQRWDQDRTAGQITSCLFFCLW